MPQDHVYFSVSAIDLEMITADSIRDLLFRNYPEVEFVITYSTPIEEN